VSPDQIRQIHISWDVSCPVSFEATIGTKTALATTAAILTTTAAIANPGWIDPVIRFIQSDGADAAKWLGKAEALKHLTDVIDPYVNPVLGHIVHLMWVALVASEHAFFWLVAHFGPFVEWLISHR
jgi:hypothetical protein